MSVTLDIPKDQEDTLRQAFGDNLGRAAKEALIIEGYRTGRLSIGEVSGLLGFESQFDAEQWLGKRGVNWNYGADDLKQDRDTLNRLLKIDL